MRKLLTRLFCIVLGSGLLCLTAVAESNSPDANLGEALAKAREVHRQGGYPDSFDFDVDEREGTREDDPGKSGLWSDADFRTAPWILTGIAVVLLIVLLPSLSREPPPPSSQREDASGEEDKADWEPDAEPVWIRGDPDDLARAGLWNDAIAALLYRSLLMTGWRPEGRNASLTAREILLNHPRNDPRLPHMKRILLTAERIRFGGMMATKRLFEKTRQLFRLMTTEGERP